MTAGHRVFISHSGRDTWVARQIATSVRGCGGEPFLDEADVQVGDDFEERIRDFLASTDELLVLLTPWAMTRSFVWAEIGAAWSRRIPIVCVLHGQTVADVQANTNVPVFLKRRDMIDINELDEYFSQLRGRCSR